MTSPPGDARPAPNESGAERVAGGSARGGAGSAPEVSGAERAAGDSGRGGAGSTPEVADAERAAGGSAPGEPAGAGRDGGFAAAEHGAAPARSGLRNPAAAVRGLGAGTLVLEAIVLLLAIQPIRTMGGDLRGWGIGAVVGLAVLAALLAGMMGRRWAWGAGAALQALLIASGLLHWSLAVLGLIFAAAWGYATHVRRTILD